MTLSEMRAEAQRAKFRPMLDVMAGHIVDMFEAVMQRCRKLGKI